MATPRQQCLRDRTLAKRAKRQRRLARQAQIRVVREQFDQLMRTTAKTV